MVICILFMESAQRGKHQADKSETRTAAFNEQKQPVIFQHTGDFTNRFLPDVQAVKYAFSGIRAGVLALIIRALWLMYKNVEKCAVSYIVMAAAFILSAFTSVNVIIVIAGCALFGLITAYINTKKK